MLECKNQPYLDNENDKQFYIKHVNTKNIPTAEGFWNPQGVVHNGLIYAIQNVDG